MTRTTRYALALALTASAALGCRRELHNNPDSAPPSAAHTGGGPVPGGATSAGSTNTGTGGTMPSANPDPGYGSLAMNDAGRTAQESDGGVNPSAAMSDGSAGAPAMQR